MGEVARGGGGPARLPSLKPPSAPPPGFVCRARSSVCATAKRDARPGGPERLLRDEREMQQADLLASATNESEGNEELVFTAAQHLSKVDPRRAHLELLREQKSRRRG